MKMGAFPRVLGLSLILAGSMFAADVPRPVPPTTISMASGPAINLAKYKGKVVALQVLLTTCPHCQHTSAILENLYKQQASKGFEVIGVAIDDNAQHLVGKYAKDLGLTFPVGYMDRNTVHAFLQHPVMMIMYVPQLVLIDRNGIIQAQYDGQDQFWVDQEKNLPAKVQEMLAKK